jgi:hypothetical protein
VLQQQLAGAASARFAQLQCAGDGRRHQVMLMQRRQVDKHDALGVAVHECGGDGQGQAGLPDAAGSYQRQQPRRAGRRVQERAGLGHLALAADERRRRDGQRHLRTGWAEPHIGQGRACLALRGAIVSQVLQARTLGRRQPQCADQRLEGVRVGPPALLALDSCQRVDAQAGALREGLLAQPSAFAQPPQLGPERYLAAAICGRSQVVVGPGPPVHGGSLAPPRTNNRGGKWVGNGGETNWSSRPRPGG